MGACEEQEEQKEIINYEGAINKVPIHIMHNLFPQSDISIYTHFLADSYWNAYWGIKYNKPFKAIALYCYPNIIYEILLLSFYLILEVTPNKT